MHLGTVVSISSPCILSTPHIRDKLRDFATAKAQLLACSPNHSTLASCPLTETRHQQSYDAALAVEQPPLCLMVTSPAWFTTIGITLHTPRNRRAPCGLVVQDVMPPWSLSLSPAMPSPKSPPLPHLLLPPWSTVSLQMHDHHSSSCPHAAHDHHAMLPPCRARRDPLAGIGGPSWCLVVGP